MDQFITSESVNMSVYIVSCYVEICLYSNDLNISIINKDDKYMCIHVFIMYYNVHIHLHCI